MVEGLDVCVLVDSSWGDFFFMSRPVSPDDGQAAWSFFEFDEVFRSPDSMLNPARLPPPSQNVICFRNHTHVVVHQATLLRACRDRVTGERGIEIALTPHDSRLWRQFKKHCLVQLDASVRDRPDATLICTVKNPRIPTRNRAGQVCERIVLRFISIGVRAGSGWAEVELVWCSGAWRESDAMRSAVEQSVTSSNDSVLSSISALSSSTASSRFDYG